jgi:PAS domain S-box-containing protein
MTQDKLTRISGNIGDAVYKNSMDAILLTSPDGKIIAANPAACDLFSQTEQEILSMGRNGLVDLTDKRLPLLLEERERSGKAKGELSFVKKDGSKFEGEITSEIFKDKHGAHYTVMIIRDIDARRKQEEDIHLRGEILTNMAEGMHLTRESDLTIIYANPQFEKMFGYYPGELIGRNVAVLNAPVGKTSEEKAEEVLSILRKDGFWKGEILNIKKNGTPFWCSVNVSVFKSLKHDNVWVSIHQDISDRKIAENELRISEERYRNLVELSPVGISIYQDGKFVYVNSTGLKIMRADEQNELIGKPVLSIVHPDSKKVVLERMMRVANGESQSPLEEKLVRLNGEVFDAEVTAIPTTYNDRPAGQVLVIDISKRKKAEFKLLESEEKYRLLSEQSGLGLGLYSLDGEILYFNDQALKYLGGEIGKFLGKNVKEIFGESTGETYIERFRTAAASPGSVEYEDFVIFGKTERWIFSSHKKICDREGKIIGIQVLAQDITSRKRIEDNLRHSNAYNRRLLEASIDPLVTIGEDGKILDVNNATLSATGFSRDEMLGTDFSNYFTDPLKARAGYVAVFSSGFVKDYPLFIKSKNGSIIPVLYNATIFHDGSGKIAGVFAAARDITQLKILEKKLRKSSRELRQLNQHLVKIREEEKKQISHDLHDDLGQKLTALQMDISWLRPRIGVQSRNVENKLMEMISLTNNAIDSVKKIAYGLRPSILDDLGLRPAIEWQLADFYKVAGIKYEVSFIPEIIEVENNLSLAVFRIIQEALTNVARHSEATIVSVSLIVRSKLKLIISDNGVGINTKKLLKHKSFGLQGIVERVDAFGGEAKITGKKGKGTEILVVIPIKKKN